MRSPSSDSWILIALTIFVVLLLFYLSKKMICSSTNADDDVEASPTSSEPGGPSTSTSFSDHLSIIPNLVDGFSSQEYQDGDDPSTNRGNGSWPRESRAEYFCNGYRHPLRPIQTQLSNNEQSSVSIIISRKDVLEGQLRTQLGRISEAEKEIQRLIQLFRAEEGMHCSQHCLANLPPPSTATFSTKGEATEGNSSSPTASTAPMENDDHNIPPPSSTSSTEVVDEAHHHEANVEEIASLSTLSSQSHRLHSQSFPILSNIIPHNNNPTGNYNGRPNTILGRGERPSWSPEEFPVSGRPQYHPCPCNLSRAMAGANYSRRMLMLQRMLLLPPVMMTVFGRRDFLPRITCFLPYNDAQSYYHHYLLRDPQSRSRHHHHHHNHQHQFSISSNVDEPPPAYEECIKA